MTHSKRDAREILKNHSSRVLRIEKFESREMLHGSPVEFEGIGYFSNPNLAVIERFDIAAEQWLSSLTLEGRGEIPSAFHFDADGIYAAYDEVAFRFDLDGSERTHLSDAPNSIIALHSDGDILFLNHTSGLYTKITTINKSSNTVVDTMDDYLDALGGSSIASSKNKLFGRSIGTSPSDITFVTYDDAGNLLSNNDSSYHGDFPTARRTWVFGDERYVIDDSGTIYSTGNLTHSGRLGTHVTDVTFLEGTVPIVLDGAEVTAYSTGFLPTGTMELDAPANKLIISGDNVLAFSIGIGATQGYTYQSIALSDLSAPNPGDEVDPNGLPYEPDDLFVAQDGSVLLFEKEHQSIFRWDPVSRGYSQSIRLLDSPEYVAYSEDRNILYTANASGLIRSLDLNQSELVEEPFFVLPETPVGLTVNSNHVIAEDISGAWTTMTTIDHAGIVVESKEWHYPSRGLIWNEAAGEVFFISTYSPNDLHARPISESGRIGRDRDSTLHGSNLIGSPVRVSEDGSIAVTAAGGVFDVETLAPSEHGLSNTVTDLDFFHGEVYSVRNIAGVSQVQRWTGSSYEQTGIRQFSNEGLRLTSIGDEALLLVSINDDGVPEFNLLDTDLEDATITSQAVEITWDPPSEMLSFQQLSATQLSATADAEGTFVYSPNFGEYIGHGTQELRVDFVPEDPTQYRSATKFVTIDVFDVDFGDAPEELPGVGPTQYEVMFTDGGAHHALRNSLRLGVWVDLDNDGAPTNNNNEGDNASVSDEDGIFFASTILSGVSGSTGSLQLHASDSGYASAWIDFNRDGIWSGSEEQIANDLVVQAERAGFHLMYPSRRRQA